VIYDVIFLTNLSQRYTGSEKVSDMHRGRNYQLVPVITHVDAVAGVGHFFAMYDNVVV